jgi:hypothetical protein
LPGLMHTSSVMSLFSTKYLGPRFVITCEMMREAIREAIRIRHQEQSGPAFRHHRVHVAAWVVVHDLAVCPAAIGARDLWGRAGAVVSTCMLGGLPSERATCTSSAISG